MPATKTKSPALAPRLQVPSALIAPGGLSVFTPLGEGACAKPRLEAMAIAVTQARASRGNIWALHLERLFDPPTHMRAGANDGQRIRANPLRMPPQRPVLLEWLRRHPARPPRGARGPSADRR